MITVPGINEGEEGQRGVAGVLVSSGTYLWLPFRSGWVVGVLWCLLLVQVGMLVWGMERRRMGWEPYSFGEWEQGVKWPT